MDSVRTVSALLLSLLALGASASPFDFNGPRMLADVAVRPGTGVEVPQVPVATNGTTFFTAWVADHNGDTAVFGARLALDGRVVDPLGLRLATTDLSYGSVGVVWNGSEYVVFAPSSTGIIATQVTSNGSVVERIRIDEPGLFLVNAAVWNGSRYALLIREKTDSGAVIVKLVMVGPDFRVETSRALNDAASHTGGASLATDGTGFFLVWENFTDENRTDVVRAQRLDASGAPAESARVVPLGTPATAQYLGSFWPAASSNGSGYTIVWMSSGIWGITMSAAGEFGTPFQITDQRGSFPSIAWNGSEHLVTWTRAAFAPDGMFHLDGARLTPAGQVTPLPTLAASDLGEAQAALAANPSGYLGIWFGDVFSGSSHRSLTNRYYDQLHPLLAAGATNVLATWSEGGSVYAARLNESGEGLDGAGIQLVRARRNEDLVPVLALSNGHEYLVAWRNAAFELRFTRLSEDGTLLDAEGGVLLTENGASLTGASDGKDFLLAWAEMQKLVSLRIPAGGAATAEPKPLLPSKFEQAPKAMLWTGSRYALLWQEAFDGGNVCDPYLCSRPQSQRISSLDRDGNLLGTGIIGVNLDILGMEQTGNELLVAFGSDGTYTQRFTFGGDPASERMLVHPQRLSGVLSETQTGFAIFYGSGRDVLALLLDHFGLKDQTIAVFNGKEVDLTDALFVRGATWLAWTAPAAVTDTSQPLRRALTGQLRATGLPASPVGVPGGRRRPG